MAEVLALYQDPEDETAKGIGLTAELAKFAQAFSDTARPGKALLARECGHCAGPCGGEMNPCFCPRCKSVAFCGAECLPRRCARDNFCLSLVKKRVPIVRTPWRRQWVVADAAGAMVPMDEYAASPLDHWRRRAW